MDRPPGRRPGLGHISKDGIDAFDRYPQLATPGQGQDNDAAWRFSRLEVQAQQRDHRIRRIPASLDAHRLVRLAGREGLADAAVEALFHAYFTDGADIGDLGTLGLVADSIGLPPGPTRRALAAGVESEPVHAENLRAHRLGINGVPCFLLEGRHAIAGAQEPEVLDRLLDVALVGG